MELVEGTDKVMPTCRQPHGQALSFRAPDVALHLRAMETRIHFCRVAIESEHVPECRAAGGWGACERCPNLDPPDAGVPTRALQGGNQLFFLLLGHSERLAVVRIRE